MLKTFENFEVDNSKIWIIGVPSGEALQVTKEQLDDLYKNHIIKYSTQYTDIGFYIFDDNNVKQILKLIKPPTQRIPNDYMIYDNEFDENLIKMIKTVIENHDEYVELYISSEFLGITFGKSYIEIKKNNEGPKYELDKRFDGSLLDSYVISTEKLLLKRIEIEMNQ